MERAMIYLLAGLALGAIGVHPVAVVAILAVAWMAQTEGDDGD